MKLGNRYVGVIKALDPPEYPPPSIKQIWVVDGVRKPLPRLRTYVVMYATTVQGGINEEWLYRVVWINHKTYKVGLRLVSS